MSKNIVAPAAPICDMRESAELALLRSMPDHEIDFTDIIETSSEDWEGACRGRFYRPPTQPVIVHLVADVI